MKTHGIILLTATLLGCSPPPAAERIPIPRYQFQSEILRKTPAGFDVSVIYKFDPVTGKTWCAQNLGAGTPAWQEVTDAQSIQELLNTNQP